MWKFPGCRLRAGVLTHRQPPPSGHCGVAEGTGGGHAAALSVALRAAAPLPGYLRKIILLPVTLPRGAGRLGRPESLAHLVVRGHPERLHPMRASRAGPRGQGLRPPCPQWGNPPCHVPAASPPLGTDVCSGRFPRPPDLKANP